MHVTPFYFKDMLIIRNLQFLLLACSVKNENVVFSACYVHAGWGGSISHVYSNHIQIVLREQRHVHKLFFVDDGTFVNETLQAAARL